MRKKNLVGALLVSALLVGPVVVQAKQIGPRIKVGGGSVSIGGLTVGKDGVELPTIDQLIDDSINSTPLTLLSDADKNNIRDAVKTTGVVAAIVNDPITGIVVAQIIYGDGEKEDIPIPTVNAPPTGNSWSFSATCIVQQEGELITAMFNDDPTDLDKISDGDTLNLTASYCAEYGSKSVTSVKIKMTGRSDFPDVKPPRYRHYIVGQAN